jgi:hypothetical protein
MLGSSGESDDRYLAATHCGLFNASMMCSLDYLQIPAKQVTTTCQQHSVVALQAEISFSKLIIR